MEMQEAATWHYFAAMFLLCVLGALAHVARAVFNVLPDRLSDKPSMDLVISSGFDWKDKLLGVEYDENGYYRLDSFKNLRISMSCTVISGMFFMLLGDGASRSIAAAIDEGLAALIALFHYRVDNITWW